MPTIKQHLVSLYVSNKFGVLNRVTQVFARRGFNIDSLIVSGAFDPKFSHMNIVASGDEATIVLIMAQLAKLVDVVHATDTTASDVIERELALVKVQCPVAKRTEIIEIVSTFKGQIVDLVENALTIQVTGDSGKVDALHRMLSPYGVVEMVRSGKIFVARGSEKT